MKKLMIMAAVLSSVAFARDFEHRERMEIEELMNKPQVSREMSARDRDITAQNMEKYSDFHWELMNMDRGHDDR